jgi:tetratricopeptide (TPR) repeat protein
MRLRDEVLPKMKPQMDDEAFKQVQRALDQHVGTRQRLVVGFGEFLDTMDEVVMEVKQLVDSADVEGAIQRKRDFELQIAPSLRNSRRLLRQMSSQITAVDDLMNRLETQESEDQVVASGELIDTIVMQSDRQQTLDHISQRLVTTHGVDEQVLQKPGVSAVAPHIRNQIDQVIAAQRGMAARGIPATPQTLYRMGMLAAYRRDYDVAIDYFRQATQADPEYAAAFQATSWLQQSRAMHDLQAGDYGAALEKLAEARAAAGQIRPRDQALVLQGYVAKTQAQIAERTQNQTDRDKYLREAAQFFQSAVQLNPDNAGAHNGLGNVEYMLENLDAAIAAIEQAIQLNPNYTAAHHDLGAVLMAKVKEAQKQSDRTRADEWCRKALRAFERSYQLSERDPGFSNDDRVRIRGYISWLQGQCGPSHT